MAFYKQLSFLFPLWQILFFQIRARAHANNTLTFTLSAASVTDINNAKLAK